jgi:hypothetical protein
MSGGGLLAVFGIGSGVAGMPMSDTKSVGTAGMVHANVGQKLLKSNILRIFSMSHYKFLMLLFA